MKMGLKASSSRSLRTLITAGLLAGLGLHGCVSDSGGSLPPILPTDDLEQVAVAPAPQPAQQNNSTPITTPSFGQISPPPVAPARPAPPTLVNNALSILAARTAFVEIELGTLFVPGVIANVEVQIFNATQGTNVTAVFDPASIAQFRSLLIGRGGTFQDREQGITLANEPGNSRFTFRGLSVAVFDAAIAPAADPNSNTQDQIVIVITITDSFGQILRQEARTGSPAGGAGGGGAGGGGAGGGTVQAPTITQFFSDFALPVAVPMTPPQPFTGTDIARTITQGQSAQVNLVVTGNPTTPNNFEFTYNLPTGLSFTTIGPTTDGRATNCPGGDTTFRQPLTANSFVFSVPNLTGSCTISVRVNGNTANPYQLPVQQVPSPKLGLTVNP